MSRHERKREQSLTYEGRVLPRGLDESRTCDIASCPGGSESLVSAPGGSVLLVCATHASDLTSPVVEPVEVPGGDVTPPPAPRQAWVTRERVLALVRVVLGIVLIVWGLSICAGPGDDFDGIVTGTIGAFLVLNRVRPRYRDA